MSYERLYSEFDFTDADLNANRAGDITERQRARLSSHGNPLMAGFALTPLLCGCLTLFNLGSFSVFLVPPLAVLLIFCWIQAFVIGGNLRGNGRIRVAEGTVSRNISRARSGGLIFRPVIYVDRKRFQITVTQAKAFRDGEQVRIHYVPLMPLFNEVHVLSVETFDQPMQDYFVSGDGMLA